ncbi:MAG: sugar kinase [Lachnospiraceae bacterium]|nr:sugar kinase [Lachnospiraceae bacterium]
MENTGFITFGEIMMRLTAPDCEKIVQAKGFDANYGGSEANIAVSLANLGIKSSVITVLPDNPLGQSVLKMLKSNDVDTGRVILAKKDEVKTHRLGVYYMEKGFGIRPGNVIYDRKNSCITEYDFGELDPREILKGYSWFHVSGISLAISSSCREFAFELIKTAKEMGLTVSFDGNFRSALWTFEEARDCCSKCLPYVDVLFGIEPFNLYREKDNKGSGDLKEDIPFQPDKKQQEEVFKAFTDRYPNIKCIARHVRYTKSGNENSLKAYIFMNDKTYESSLYTFDILDRVGGGDAFIAGFIYAYLKGFAPEETAEFAVAASVIKHTIKGDINVTNNESDIRAIMGKNFDIKR